MWQNKYGLGKQIHMFLFFSSTTVILDLWFFCFFINFKWRFIIFLAFEYFEKKNRWYVKNKFLTDDNKLQINGLFVF